MDFFAENGIQVLDWPGNSADLSPIENVWAYMKRHLQTISKPCSHAERSYQEKSGPLNFIEYFHILVQSMPQRLEKQW